MSLLRKLVTLDLFFCFYDPYYNFLRLENLYLKILIGSLNELRDLYHD